MRASIRQASWMSDFVIGGKTVEAQEDKLVIALHPASNQRARSKACAVNDTAQVFVIIAMAAAEV